MMTDKQKSKLVESHGVLCDASGDSEIDALRDNYYNTGFAGLVGDLAHLAQGGI